MVVINSTRNRVATDFQRWVADRHGFAACIHFVQGFPSQQAQKEARETLRCGLVLSYVAKGNVIVNTIVGPAYGVIQLVSLPNSSDMENNLVAFEHEKAEPDLLALEMAHLQLAGTSASGGV